METFVVLLLVIFVPFVWYIVRMLRYTDETIGENSPLYRERTYQLSVSQYFFTFYKMMLLFLFGQMCTACWLLLQIATKNSIALPLLFGCFFAAFAGYIVYFFYIDWQYWTITRHVQLTLNPFEPSIQVDSPNQTVTLTPDNLARIEWHRRKSDNPKEPLYDYGYYLFYDTDETVVRINKLFFNHIEEFLERYFSAVPITIVWHKLPPITPMNIDRNRGTPNFANQ